MGGRAGAALAAAAILWSAAGPARAEVPVPALSGPVVDQAGVLDDGDVRRLSSLSRAARQASGGEGPQLQFLVIRSLDGEPIEDFSMRVAERWGLGSRAADNGVLVTVAIQDRQARIEVGGGVEGELTDVASSRIIREVMGPAFREGRYGDGLYDAGQRVLGALGALPDGMQVQRRPARGTPGSSLLVTLFIIGIVVFNILRGFGPRRRRSLWWGGWGGGGFGGGFGGGGGGWGGGGGGFSGGGASGRW
ncbi:MAG: TPM domain-containing protein [Anaeromyxobacter sp.]